MNLPPNEPNAWLDQYLRLLARLFERQPGDFPLDALTADLRDAWRRAFTCWQAAPDRYAAVQEQWQSALLQFHHSVAANHTQPLTALADLQHLHRELGSCLRTMVRGAPGLSDSDQRLLGFGVRHLLNALAPEHWPLANQEVLMTAIATNGASFTQGLRNFSLDVADSVAGLDVKTAARDDFVLGETLAATAGEVVFENDLFQLLQYYPCTQEVLPVPLLIVPPWINKYYVLDLNPADSFVQWAVRQGHTVFIMSWVNPDASHADLGLADYLVRGCLEAATVVARLSGSRRLNVAGYCIGGFLAACAAAYLAAGNQHNIASLTLVNAMLDYSEPGDIGVFLSERMLTALEDHLQAQGILDGRIMRQAFTMLREDKVFWPYVVNNYWLGKSPEPNPVLFWNRDATNLPRRMLTEFLRDMYRHNAFRNSDNYFLAGRAIDLNRITVPVYALACRNDHIIPWRSAFNSTLMLAGEVTFVLSDAGHVMGVVNPPNKKLSGYWNAAAGIGATDADTWLAKAARHEGSWWPHWQTWIAGRQSGQVAARFPGADGNRIIERAPGRYVKIRSDI